MDLRLAPLQTARLRMEPVTGETARAIVAGDLAWLTAAGLAAADGWPHDDTTDGLAMAGKGGYPARLARHGRRRGHRRHRHPRAGRRGGPRGDRLRPGRAQ